MKSGASDSPFDEDDQNDTDESMKASTGDIDFGEESSEETTDAADSEPSIEDVFVRLLEDVQEGERKKTISFRDEFGATLLGAINESDELREQLARDLGGALDRDVDADDLDASEVARLLFRVGLQSGSPETLEAFRDARAELSRQSF